MLETNVPARNAALGQLMAIKQVALHLGVSVKTVYGWVYLRQIPYVKMGRLVKFDPADIAKWIETKKIKNDAIQ